MDKNKIKLLTLGIVGIIFFALFLHDSNTYKYKPQKKFSSFEEFYAYRLKKSKADHVLPGNEERLLRRSQTKTDLVLLFIHGFGASRAEGEMIVDQVSKKYKANAYYLRLPGHGTNAKDHASVTFKNYMDTVEEAFSMMPLLGKKTVIIGSSTGGSLATWLASKYPQKVHALILSSPFYDFYDPTSMILDIPGGLFLGQIFLGENRNADNRSPRKQKGYNDYWLIDQKFAALGALNEVQNFVNRDEVYRRITSPSLLFYYYKDENQKDTTVSIKTMFEAFHKFGTLRNPKGQISPSPFNRMVAIPDGNHILMSKYVKTDKTTVLQETFLFLDAL